MRHARIIFLLGMAAVLAGSRASAADEASPTNAAPSGGSLFESFRIVTERNIFNQNRGPRSARREQSASRPPAVVQSLSLVGTMSYEKGDFAFFEGTKPEYRKPVKPGEKIAGYEIKEITPSCVKMANEKQELQMKVGQQLRREEDGDWQLSATTTRASGSSETSTNSGLGSSEATSSGASPSEEEALKRLMEKRAKELNE